MLAFLAAIKQTLTAGPLKQSETSETDDMRDSDVE
jgi:hypothetical protein